MWSLCFVSLGILNTSNHIIIIIARYTIVLQSNEEHHDVPLNQLESLSGLPLRPEEATPVWYGCIRKLHMKLLLLIHQINYIQKQIAQIQIKVYKRTCYTL